MQYDVVVVGGGNAGFSAATTAAQSGAKRVLLVDKSPTSLPGGNTYYTVGGYRTVFDGLPDLLPFLHGLDQETVSKIVMDPYTREDFMSDIMRITKGRANPALANELVNNSRAGVQWLVDHGLQFQLSFHRQAFLVDGKQKFWGGMVMNVINGGKALYQFHLDLAKKSGVEVWYDSPAISLVTEPKTGSVIGLKVQRGPEIVEIGAKAVILCAGGFQASPEMRTRYLGPGWDLAHVRGSPYNTGDGIRMAAEVGARLVGNWSGCHSVAWDAMSPSEHGNRELTNQYTKSGYPLGLMLNTLGNRFVDEGFDIRNFTYAYFGREILKQPSGIAFQIWDSEGLKWLRKEEYAPDVVKMHTANSIEELAKILEGRGLRDPGQFVRTVKEYNEACYQFRRENPHVKFDPAVKDGVSTQSSKKALPLGKTNWAVPLDKGQFGAVEVTCGITFTFGGLSIDPATAGVMSDRTRKPIKGLYCAGEMVGDMFYDNYPGGSGLMMGVVFGRKAGKAAAELSKSSSYYSDVGISRANI